MKTMKLLFSAFTACAAMMLAGCSKDNGKIAVTEVRLNKTELLLPVGGQETLNAEILPENASDQTLEWTSSAPDIASVDQTGKVMALAAGSATITAEAGGKSAHCELTVSDSFGGVTVYAGGSEYDNEINKYIGKIWKNGGLIFSTDPSYHCFIRSIFVSDGDVYAGGYSEETPSGNRIARIWKNGQQIFSTDEGGNAEIHSICVSNGSVYAGGFEWTAETGNTIAKVWKDGTATDYPPKNNFNSYIYSIRVTDNGDVYAGGDEDREAAIWKNGESIHLGEYLQEIHSIFLSGSDVYAGGYIYKNGTDTPAVWKNGEIEYTIYATEHTQISSIYVWNGDVYAGGIQQTATGFRMKIWKNEDTLFSSENGYGGNIGEILIHGGDIYAGGSILPEGAPNNIARIWKNGEVIFSTDGISYYALISSIVVQ